MFFLLSYFEDNPLGTGLVIIFYITPKHNMTTDPQRWSKVVCDILLLGNICLYLLCGRYDAEWASHAK